jgi:predicted branched-subunit amino acid permease
MNVHPRQFRRVRPPAACWSLAGLAEGALRTLPALRGAAFFAAAFGAIAAQKGLSLGDAVLMSLFVCSGAVQLVAMELWTNPLTLAALATLGAVTATISLRFVLVTASLRPWLGTLPAWQSYPTLYPITDPSWLVAMRYRAEGGADAGIVAGSCLAMWVVWVGATVPGFLLGELVSDPRRFGLDLIMPAVLVAMLVPLWRGSYRAIPWLVAGEVALTVESLVPGWWFIVAGGVAGSIAGGYLDD